MSKNKTKIAIISLCLLSFIFLPGAICRKPAVKLNNFKLEIWGLFDSTDAFSGVIADYAKINSNVQIAYSKKEYAGYEDLIVNSMAESGGPDIFLINSKWIDKYSKKIIPMPDGNPPANEIAVPAGKFGVNELKRDFADVVNADVLADGQIYGLPLSVDTLALYYNKTDFNNAGIPQPPENWTEFKDDVAKLRKMDEKGTILNAGAALGTGSNINRSMDILMLLMLQSGAQMASANRSQATFSQSVKSGGQSYSPGIDALKFYTDFANPASSVYTWNSKMDYSIDAFTQKKSSMIFGYSYLKDEILKKQPNLDFEITKIPQIEGSPLEVNFANYWVFTVSRFSQNSGAAWDFVKFLTSKIEAEKYLRATGNPTARKDLINSQLDDSEISAFVSQILTAKSWYQKDSIQTENIFVNMIDDVVLGRRSIEDSIKYAEDRVTQTMK